MNDAEANQNMEQKCPQCGAPLPSGVLAGLCPACLFKQGAAADTAPPPEIPPFVPPRVEEMARLFPQLEIIALLGKGGMGAVYKARQPALDRIVALKILPSNPTGGTSFNERFNREARALARLNHPNIVTVYEFGQTNGLPFFIMEFVDGLNLRQLEQAGKLTPVEALQIVPQICEALQFAHDEGIVHRDIKPENILVDKKGRVKIADFGIAKILGREPDVTITETGGTVGTPHYMAPEQMEKPATVDHRADIFSLGVVFYEMLTGELPLGKFSPPSTRRVQVDVRLDDVVLRALEKDPELRYQHASQVKTAVDSIAGQAPPPPPPPVTDANALAQEILAKDYHVSIRSCLRRSWALVKKDFWPLIGVTALVLVLLSFVSSIGGITLRIGGEHDAPTTGSGVASLISMLAWGPLMGGLSLYYLKKMRGQPTNIEVAFSGFTQHFLHLFLGGFVASLLTWLGFLCLLLPGIYLMVAWWFTLTLIIDKRLDFWSAMELSRKVVTRHWWKLFGLALVALLLYALGLVCCLVGIFITAPIGMIAATYAYEDIFGQSRQLSGPSGTVVMPGAPRKPMNGVLKMGLVIAAVLLIGYLSLALYMHIKRFHGIRHQHVPRPNPIVNTVNAAADEPTNAPAPVIFGPVIEQDLTNFEAICLASGKTSVLPDNVSAQNRGPDKDLAAGKWMAQAEMDFTYLGNYDGFYGQLRDITILPRSDWDNYSPKALAAALGEGTMEAPCRFGDGSPLNNPVNYTYGFKTRDGSLGLLQIVGATSNQPGVKIRYKLVPPSDAESTTDSGQNGKPSKVSEETRIALNERLEAASDINNAEVKDRLLSNLANDAADAGMVEIVNKSLAAMYNQNERDDATLAVTRVLAKRGMRKEAIELAKGIGNYTIRDQTLSELAQ